MAHILQGDLDTGFLLMHQALEEDKRLTGRLAPQAPALAFTILDSEDPNQAFLDQVRAYATFVEDRLLEYRTSGRGALTLSDLRARVLHYPGELLVPLFQVVFVAARLLKLQAPATRPARSNQFADLFLGQLAFDMCLVVDGAIAGRYPPPRKFLSLAADYIQGAKLQMLGSDLHKVNELRKEDFGATLRGLATGSSYGLVESDLLITYVLRNQMAHGLAAEPDLRLLFDDVERRLFFAFFGIVERSYP